jgi:hypothetical protein
LSPRPSLVKHRRASSSEPLSPANFLSDPANFKVHCEAAIRINVSFRLVIYIPYPPKGFFSFLDQFSITLGIDKDNDSGCQVVAHSATKSGAVNLLECFRGVFVVLGYPAGPAGVYLVQDLVKFNRNDRIPPAKANKRIEKAMAIGSSGLNDSIAWTT